MTRKHRVVSHRQRQNRIAVRGAGVFESGEREEVGLGRLPEAYELVAG